MVVRTNFSYQNLALQNIKGEKWKPVGYLNGYYEVSNGLCQVEKSSDVSFFHTRYLSRIKTTINSHDHIWIALRDVYSTIFVNQSFHFELPRIRVINCLTVGEANPGLF